jgi:uncharacterized membrane protein
MIKLLKKIAIAIGGILSMLALIYFHIADNITLKIFWFITNEWHLKQSTNPKKWVWIITGYRIATLALIILCYYLIKYTYNEIF